jgi:hypothetical protein
MINDCLLNIIIEQVDHLGKLERHSHKGTIKMRLDHIKNLLKSSSGNEQLIITLNF